MADPGKSTQAEVRYQVQIKEGPCKFRIGSVEHELRCGSDAAVVVRSVVSGRTLMDETIVCVIDTVEFLRIRAFLNQGGVVGLHRDLVG